MRSWLRKERRRLSEARKAREVKEMGWAGADWAEAGASDTGRQLMTIQCRSSAKARQERPGVDAGDSGSASELSVYHSAGKSAHYSAQWYVEHREAAPLPGPGARNLGWVPEEMRRGPARWMQSLPVSAQGTGSAAVMACQHQSKPAPPSTRKRRDSYPVPPTLVPLGH